MIQNIFLAIIEQAESIVLAVIVWAGSIALTIFVWSSNNWRDVLTFLGLIVSLGGMVVGIVCLFVAFRIENRQRIDSERRSKDSEKYLIKCIESLYVRLTGKSFTPEQEKWVEHFAEASSYVLTSGVVNFELPKGLFNFPEPPPWVKPRQQWEGPASIDNAGSTPSAGEEPKEPT